jgi:hypothetical protein
MNCAEAVKPAPILWNPRENQSRTQSPATSSRRRKRKNKRTKKRKIEFGLIRADPRKSVAKWFRAKQMRPGQPPDRIVRGFLLALSPLGDGA